MLLLFFVLLPKCFGQFLMPFVYDPAEMAAEMNYMNQQIMAQNKAIQRQIFLQNNARMHAIPADGKVHSYVDRIPGGVSRGTSYHSKNPNGEEYAESHFTSQAFGQGKLLKEESPQIPLGLQTPYSNYLQTKLMAGSYGSPAISYEFIPTFYKASTNKISEDRIPVYSKAADKLSEYGSKYKAIPAPQPVDVIPITTEVIVPQVVSTQPEYPLPLIFPRIRLQPKIHQAVHLMQQK